MKTEPGGIWGYVDGPLGGGDSAGSGRGEHWRAIGLSEP